MLTRGSSETVERLMPMLDRQPELAVRANALLRAYGTERPFFNVWVQNDVQALLTRLDNTFSLIDLNGTDYEEIAFFLDFNPYFKRLTGELGAVRATAEHFEHAYKLESFNLLRQETYRPVRPMPFVTLNEQPDLRVVFALITAAMPHDANFPAWYTDLNHRIRHGCARAYLLELGGESVAACLISAESDRAGLISGLATRPDSRGCGLGARMLSCACGALRVKGKTPVLECADSLVPFYEKAGFVKTGEGAELDIF